MTLSEQQQRFQQRVDDRLLHAIRSLDDHAPSLKAAMEYALVGGGKRLRPFLVYVAGEMLGASLEDLDAPAMALECIHAYSLIHDDLPAMDDDDLRRGRPTCHIQFDEATAILAGDALQTLAFELISAPSSVSAENQINAIRLLSEASGYSGMCGGQAMDLAATDSSISQETLELLHQKKTGALIKCAVDLACAYSPDTAPKDAALLSKYAQLIGLAFQVQDDILDIVGDSETLGKPQGSDLALNKSTFPSLLGLEGAKQYLTEIQQQALQALESLPYNSAILEAFTHYIGQRDH